MKKLLLPMAICCSLSAPTFAEQHSGNWQPNTFNQQIDIEQEKSFSEKTLPLKQGTTFLTSAVLGGIAAGPLGFILGAVGGSYLGETIGKADEVDVMESSLAQANSELQQMDRQLVLTQQQVNDATEIALEALSLPVLFQTGSDKLSARGQKHVAALAQFMVNNPELNIRLMGHTDPRGTDEYNNVLSNFRAGSVSDALQNSGVAIDRIQSSGQGMRFSNATPGDAKSYVHDRKVTIELKAPSSIVMN